MTSDAALRHRVADAIRSGTLPHGSPVRTWGGRGSGACCEICSERIGAEELEFELEFQGSQKYLVHRRCFFAWEAERRQSDGNLGGVEATELCGAPAGTNFHTDDREAHRSQDPG